MLGPWENGSAAAVRPQDRQCAGSTTRLLCPACNQRGRNHSRGAAGARPTQTRSYDGRRTLNSAGRARAAFKLPTTVASKARPAHNPRFATGAQTGPSNRGWKPVRKRPSRQLWPVIIRTLQTTRNSDDAPLPQQEPREPGLTVVLGVGGLPASQADRLAENPAPSPRPAPAQQAKPSRPEPSNLPTRAAQGSHTSPCCWLTLGRASLFGGKPKTPSAVSTAAPARPHGAPEISASRDAPLPGGSLWATKPACVKAEDRALEGRSRDRPAHC